MNDGQDIRDLIAYYQDQGAPSDQQMLIALLKEAQDAEGGILSRATLLAISEAYGLKESILQAFIRRIPTLRYEDIPHKLEICATCKKSNELRELIEVVYGLKSGDANRQAGFSYRTVNCMKNCKNGPSVRWDGTLYSKATVELLRALIEKH